MKKLNVTIKDKNTLILNEDAQKGDYIDLSEFMEVDATEIENNINAKKDVVYEKRFNEYKDVVILKNNKIIEELNSKIETLKQEQEILLKDQEYKLNKKYGEELTKLKMEIASLKDTKDSEIATINSGYQIKLKDLKSEKEQEIMELSAKYKGLNDTFKINLENETLKVKESYIDKINELQSKINNLTSEVEIKLKIQENKLNEVRYEELNKQKDVYELKLKEQENKINELTRQKANLNIKQIGEDLEIWCNSQVMEYMQNGFFNCEWIKDNKVIKEDDEVKGSKADYIFKVYASDKKEDNELLTSICLDMKDENPDSINKKGNADYYKTLDKNKIKKQCKYALLVSNLERNNNLPMWRVREYDDMYVVRPEYLMTFLNIITSLTNKFSKLVLADKEEKINLKASIDLMSEFDKLKETYLDKPLLSLEKDVTDIAKCSEAIISSASKISDTCNRISSKYIYGIQEKLNKFEVGIVKQYRKYEKEVVDE